MTAMNHQKGLVWMRGETKKREQRAPLTPNDTHTLITRGHAVHVESSSQRIFTDDEYTAAGCIIERPGSWPKAPSHANVLGIKELPAEEFPISNRHIYFAHAYRGQPGAAALLARFARGKGAIFDVEYLRNEEGKRVISFGKWGGFAGAALALDVFCHQRMDAHSAHPGFDRPFDSAELIHRLKKRLSQAKARPSVIIVGERGRTGRGAKKLLEELDIHATEWGREETKHGGPFLEILDHDIFINCVFIREPVKPFVTLDLLKRPNRRLAVIADVSCDVGNPCNVLPVYDRITTFDEPARRIVGGRTPLDIVAIDHLPSLVPRDSSVDFSGQLLPHLITLLESDKVPKIWSEAYRPGV